MIFRIFNKKHHEVREFYIILYNNYCDIREYGSKAYLESIKIIK